MPQDAPTLDESERSRTPRLENFALELPPGNDPAPWLALLAERRGGAWRAREVAGFTLLEPVAEGRDELSVGDAWGLARALFELGALSAEPTFQTRMPPPTAAEAARHFGLWGHTPEARRNVLVATSEKNRHWATDLMGCPKAWSTWTEKHGKERPAGQGVRVAQLDTGYTPHWRIVPSLEKVGDHIGISLVGDDEPQDRLRDARDPLPPKLPLISFPGHGTAVAGLVCLGDVGKARPRGVAPGATILPMRVSRSVIHMSFQNVCDAFQEAIDRRVDVISMSLGGPISSGQLYQRVHAALDEGILVIAAAGNALPGVVFPAAVPGVVACAACNVLAAPWNKSGLGDAVTITAPGEYVWYEKAVRAENEDPEPRHGDGTSYATAHVAGLAALWLSYHGRDSLIADACGGKKELLPYLFRACLQSSAEPRPELAGFGFGAGIARADFLLEADFPKVADLEAARQEALEAGRKTWLRFQSWPQIFHLPTLTGTPAARVRDPDGEDREKLERLLLGGEKLDELDFAELQTLAATHLELATVLAKTASGARHWVSGEALRRFLLRQAAGLSPDLRRKLERGREQFRRDLAAKLPDIRLKPVVVPPGMASQPRVRRLKAYAFDPSLQTSSTEVGVNEITITVPFEPELLPGPIGEYLEVVDVDPASGCAYSPVDLDHPWLLAQDGVDRSESNPHFHQQMVYAVGMKTIVHFEEALGRPIFWAPLRPWDRTSDDRANAAEITVKGKPVLNDQFVRRLRLYPHALRSQNAFYSPAKRAILFGYFPAGSGAPGAEYPGGMVFTCLAHDIIAHEMTHALLDGIHYRYTEPTNPDVYAFHEAFADIVALLQRFTYRELLEDQIAKARGRLDAGTLMTRLALQFGQATGRHHALRDALGYIVEQSRQKAPEEWRTLGAEPGPDGSSETTIVDAARPFGDDLRHVWQRFKADPTLLDQVEEPHQRGAFLVAAVFDAYLTIYEARVADLKRIATGGTGVLPAGDLHPDLVRRMAHEATLAAHHVLRMCIRALDYVPPTDLTFGEYLRALITADSDLVPDDDRRYRVAFIEAFRKWGIYPRDVRTLSEESLRWNPIDLKLPASRALKDARDALMKWEPGESREEIFKAILRTQAMLHSTLENMEDNPLKRHLLGGIDTREPFNVCNLRPARRIGPRGEYLTEMVVEVLQSLPAAEGEIPFRGGATLIIGWKNDQIVVRYSIFKRLDSTGREQRQREHLAAASEGGKAAEYSTAGLPDGWFSRAEERQKWEAGRHFRAEDMRASSCDCRRQRQEARTKKTTVVNEPFALLHRR